MTKQIRVTQHHSWSWYKTGEIYDVKSETAYQDIGVQVIRPGVSTPCPDVITHGDYEVIQ